MLIKECKQLKNNVTHSTAQSIKPEKRDTK